MLVIQLKELTITQKIIEIERNITDYVHDKYITTPELNKLTAGNFAARLAQVNLVSKNDIANFVNKTDFDDKLKNLNKKVTSNKTKHVFDENELKKLSKKAETISTKYYSFFLGRMYFTSDGSQNKFVYQPTFNVLELKIDKGTKYGIGWKSKRLFNSKLVALHGAFLSNIKYFGKKIGMQFNNTPLVEEQNNYASKIVNISIVYDLDTWPKISLRNFTLKNCLFGATNVVKDNDKKSMCTAATEQHLMEKGHGV